MFAIPKRFFPKYGLEIVLVLLLTSPAARAADREVPFETGTWAELLAKAKKENKPFFVDFWATWCGPCRIMNATTFKDEQVARIVEKHYLAYKVDVEKGEGRNLSSRYNIRSMPTIVFFDANGKEIDRFVGMRPPGQFIAELQKHLSKEDQKEVATMLEAPSPSAIWDSYASEKAVPMTRLGEQIFSHPTIAAHADTLRALGKLKASFRYEDLRKTLLSEVPADLQWQLHALYLLGMQNYDSLANYISPLAEANALQPEEIGWLAWQYHHLEPIPHAPMRWINQAVRAQPNNYELLDTKAALKWRDGKAEQAAAVAQQALDAAGRKEETAKTERLLQLAGN